MSYRVYFCHLKNKIMYKIKYLIIAIFISGCQADNDDYIESISNQWVFVACEGNFGASNGSITMINELGEVKSVNDLGDIVQSVKVYKN